MPFVTFMDDPEKESAYQSVRALWVETTKVLDAIQRTDYRFPTAERIKQVALMIVHDIASGDDNIIQDANYYIEVLHKNLERTKEIAAKVKV